MSDPSTAAADQDVIVRETRAVVAPDPVQDSPPDSPAVVKAPPKPLRTIDETTDRQTPEDKKQSATDPDARTLWLRRGDQIVVWLLTVALLGLLTLHWMRLSRWGSMPVELSSQQPRESFYSLDINAASWVEWAQLEGIGEKLARRIVADRDDNGPFRRIDDVGRVSGIGPKLLEKLKPFLRVEATRDNETDSR
jgi:competence protein ComEA